MRASQIKGCQGSEKEFFPAGWVNLVVVYHFVYLWTGGDNFLLVFLYFI